MKKIIVGISGASGSIYGIDLLEKLSKATNVETHLVMSNWAKENIKLETDYSVAEVENLADFVYDNRNLGAAIASGSFRIDGMVIAPASMKTVAGISIGFDEDLIMRAASVMLKEQRKLILVPRETPLSAIHLENLTKLAKLGVHIIPPFYDHPKTIQDIVDHQTMKVLDSLNIEADFAKRWDGE
ncbi:polyprenyl P-hydroxybenzoate and phenylacrylic acid decarboxylase [Lactobacillus paragasseri JV-V03]|uniref:Flavin prenyltransferase UbiX n=1 Tax=Lactobacillus paragasseri JV-V03 TaxID=525326 RepID=A0AA87DE38_9LACO|nr:UbiX family flavin prenyltransferase [Lactobacillus paragasseri]EFJ70291.1 polyprenyl P-hydroxybenzoate and phenylacrylic acid decarboxylase [Lactobacillus paragasseri JV-V03]